MARNIDFSKPLSADEQAYVADRPWLVQNALLNGEDVLTDDDFIVDDETDSERELRESLEAQALADEAERLRLEAESNSEDDESEEESGEDDESEEEEEETEEVEPYDSWEYAALKEEAGNRDLSKAGSKEQLIQRLTENDAESNDE